MLAPSEELKARQREVSVAPYCIWCIAHCLWLYRPTVSGTAAVRLRGSETARRQVIEAMQRFRYIPNGDGAGEGQGLKLAVFEGGYASDELGMVVQVGVMPAA